MVVTYGDAPPMPQLGQMTVRQRKARYLTASDTDDTVTPRVEIPGTQTTVHDAIWDWLNLGGGTVAIRRLDTDEPGVKFSVCQ